MVGKNVPVEINVLYCQYIAILYCQYIVKELHG